VRGREAIAIARLSTCWRSLEYGLVAGVKLAELMIDLPAPLLRKKLGRSLLRIGPDCQNIRGSPRPPADYWSSFRSAWGAALACARAATEDCSRICALVRLAASVATSASRSADCADEKLDICD